MAPGKQNVNTRSLAELKAIGARQNETHQKLNQIIDYRQQELKTAQDQLYADIETFRNRKQAEVRSDVQVAVDFAVRTLPWWKRWNRALVMKVAVEYLTDIQTQVEAELIRVKERHDKLAQAEAHELSMKKAEEVGPGVAGPVDGAVSVEHVAEEEVTDVIPAGEMVEKTFEKDASYGKTDNGYGGPVEDKDVQSEDLEAQEIVDDTPVVFTEEQPV